MFGYYIEVTKSNLNMVPDNYIRKQTLTGCERYVTQELKDMEEEILGAEEKIVSLEYDIFVDIRNKITSQIERLQKIKETGAITDVEFEIEKQKLLK